MPTTELHDRDREHTSDTCAAAADVNPHALEIPRASRRYFHYTTGVKLIGIVAVGVIRRATLYVPRTERAGVWFSCRKTWEPSATKGFVHRTGYRRDATVAEMVRRGGALLRIEVPASAAPHTWADHRRISGIDRRHADGLEERARQTDADPMDWRVAYREVPVNMILSIEASDDGRTWCAVGTVNADGVSMDLDGRFVRTIKAALARCGSDDAVDRRAHHPAPPATGAEPGAVEGIGDNVAGSGVNHA